MSRTADGPGHSRGRPVFRRSHPQQEQLSGDPETGQPNPSGVDGGLHAAEQRDGERALEVLARAALVHLVASVLTPHPWAARTTAVRSRHEVGGPDQVA